MPYSKRKDLPETVLRALSDVPHAQEIYKEAFNSAWKEYKDEENRQGDKSREETAHSVAWSAVKKKYQKGSDEKWHPID